MKELRVMQSRILVSENPLFEEGYCIQHRVRGILPGCRKETDLTVTAMAGYIWVQNLWSHNGSASIAPEEWAKLIKDTPVFPDPHAPYPVTPAIEAAAYEHVLDITSCPALGMEKCHPNYRPKYDNLLYIR
jgi:hypothetical protein